MHNIQPCWCFHISVRFIQKYVYVMEPQDSMLLYVCDPHCLKMCCRISLSILPWTTRSWSCWHALCATAQPYLRWRQENRTLSRQFKLCQDRHHLLQHLDHSNLVKISPRTVETKSHFGKKKLCTLNFVCIYRDVSSHKECLGSHSLQHLLVRLSLFPRTTICLILNQFIARLMTILYIFNRFMPFCSQESMNRNTRWTGPVDQLGWVLEQQTCFVYQRRTSLALAFHMGDRGRAVSSAWSNFTPSSTTRFSTTTHIWPNFSGAHMIKKERGFGVLSVGTREPEKCQLHENVLRS